nr:methyltransferase domain-containing protein [Anaerolineales bacterium]
MNPFSYSSAQRNRNRLNVLLEHKRKGRLLDIGCGDGGFLALADEYFQVEGLDLNPAPSDVRYSFYSDQVVKADVNEFDFENGIYDAITAFNVLEHIVDPDSVIRKVYQGLRPRGIFFGSVPNNDLPVGAIHTFLTNLFDSTHCSTFHP